MKYMSDAVIQTYELPMRSDAQVRATEVKYSMRSLCFSLLILFSASTAAEDPLNVLDIRTRIAKAIPGAVAEDIRPSSIPGLYEVVVGTKLLYVTNDGKHLILGDVIDIDARVNLTEQRRGSLVATALEAIGEDNMIVIAPDETKRTITVFTDVDCPYCVKLHNEVPKLVASGVKVRYLLYPRNGLKSRTYQRSVSVWCADDRVEAIGIAKAGGALKKQTCENPVASHFALGTDLGVRGTPTTVLDDGQIVSGYFPADRLLAALGLIETAQAKSAP